MAKKRTRAQKKALKKAQRASAKARRCRPLKSCKTRTKTTRRSGRHAGHHKTKHSRRSAARKAAATRARKHAAHVRAGKKGARTRKSRRHLSHAISHGAGHMSGVHVSETRRRKRSGKRRRKNPVAAAAEAPRRHRRKAHRRTHKHHKRRRKNPIAAAETHRRHHRKHRRHHHRRGNPLPFLANPVTGPMEFGAGLAGVASGFVFARGVDRYLSTHPFVTGSDAPAQGDIYNSEAVLLPIWTPKAGSMIPWRLVAAIGSIAVPLVAAKYVRNTGVKSFLQLAGFGAVAATAGKAAEDGLALALGSQDIGKRLYGGEIAATQKQTSQLTGPLPPAPPATFAGLPANMFPHAPPPPAWKLDDQGRPIGVGANPCPDGQILTDGGCIPDPNKPPAVTPPTDHGMPPAGPLGPPTPPGVTQPPDGTPPPVPATPTSTFNPLMCCYGDEESRSWNNLNF